jgi:glucose-6-phosphate 1-dehydrogenase
MPENRMDCLVIFGATGDLAKLETFPALVGLVERGVLDVPVIGVSNAAGPSSSSAHTPSTRSSSTRWTRTRPPPGACSNCCATWTATSTTRDTYKAVGAEMQSGSARAVLPRGPAGPVRPDRRGPRRGRAGQGRPGHGREALRLRPAQRPRTQRHAARALRRGFDLPGRPLARPRVRRQRPLRPLRQRHRRADAQPHFVESIQITMAESFGVADRGRFYDQTGAVRDVMQNHMLQVLATILADPPHGTGLESWREEKSQVIASLRPLTPKTRSSASTRATGRSTASPRTRTWRPTPRSGSPATPGAGPACRSRSGRQAPAGHRDRRDRAVPPAALRRLRPRDAGAREPAALPDLAGHRRRADRRGQEAGPAVAGRARRSCLQPDAPGQETRPYDRLIAAALTGEHWLFARQETVEAAWRVVDPILTGDVPVRPYQPGTWGPERGRRADGGRRRLDRPGGLSGASLGPDPGRVTRRLSRARAGARSRSRRPGPGIRSSRRSD